MAQNQPSRDWLRFQQNLKNTSFGVRFGKKLFLNPYSISGRDATNALRLLGLEMPSEVRIGVDLAQIFASSSSLVSAYENYQTVKDAESLQALTDSSTATLKIFTSIADKNGWIDNETASALNTGINVVRILASGGADVGAWLSLGMELGIQSESAKATAQMLATKNAFDWYKGTISSQAKALTEAQMKLQKGEIGVFGFLAEAADKGNLLFENAVQNNETMQRIFPGLKFVPVFDGYYSSYGSSTTWYGDTKTASYRLDYRTIGELDEQQARQYMWHWVIEPYTKNYLEMNEYYKSRDKGTLSGAAVLACISGMNYFDDDGQIAREFEKQMLTPKDIGDSKIFNEYVSESRDSGFSLVKKVKYTKEQLNILEDKGLISEIMKDPQAKEYMKNKYTFSTFPTSETPAKIDWRDVQNFVACMDYISLVKQDPSMKGQGKGIIGIEQYDFLPSVEKWEKVLNEAYTKSLIRKVNTNAKANVAYFLGTTPEKLQRVNQVETDKPAIFTVKG